MVREGYITVPELAKLLGISRVAAYRKVKKGQIPARKIGRTYVIADRQITDILGKGLSENAKQRIEQAVRKTVRQYGELLRKLGRE